MDNYWPRVSNQQHKHFPFLIFLHVQCELEEYSILYFNSVSSAEDSLQNPLGHPNICIEAEPLLCPSCHETQNVPRQIRARTTHW